MYKDHNIIAVTPAGRESYLSVLSHYILKNKHILDQWHIWLNTTIPKDISFITSLQSQHPHFIKIIYPHKKIEANPSYSINQFFVNCQDPNTIYVRFDDDIVFIHDTAIQSLVNSRIQDQSPFLVYANIINNSICTHLHQRIKAIPYTPQVQYNCLDQIGWNDPEFAISIHKHFLHDTNYDKYMFPNWLMWEYNRFSINCFAFFGKDFKEFNGLVPTDEEEWLSVTKPKEFSRPNVISGQSLVSHYAFYTQRPRLSQTHILQQYKDLCK